MSGCIGEHNRYVRTRSPCGQWAAEMQPRPLKKIICSAERLKQRRSLRILPIGPCAAPFRVASSPRGWMAGLLSTILPSSDPLRLLSVYQLTDQLCRGHGARLLVTISLRRQHCMLSAHLWSFNHLIRLQASEDP